VASARRSELSAGTCGANRVRASSCDRSGSSDARARVGVSGRWELVVYHGDGARGPRVRGTRGGHPRARRALLGRPFSGGLAPDPGARAGLHGASAVFRRDLAARAGSPGSRGPDQDRGGGTHIDQCPGAGPDSADKDVPELLTADRDRRRAAVAAGNGNWGRHRQPRGQPGPANRALSAGQRTGHPQALGRQ
jgi:hypothetical protein